MILRKTITELTFQIELLESVNASYLQRINLTHMISNERKNQFIETLILKHFDVLAMISVFCRYQCKAF